MKEQDSGVEAVEGGSLEVEEVVESEDGRVGEAKDGGVKCDAGQKHVGGANVLAEACSVDEEKGWKGAHLI